MLGQVDARDQEKNPGTYGNPAETWDGIHPALGMAWPKVTIAALLLIAPFGALTGRRLRAIRQACAAAKTINSELLGHVRDPILKISLGIRVGIFLGIVLLMAAKPQLWMAVGVVATSVVLGLFFSAMPSRKNATNLPARSTGIGD